MKCAALLVITLAASVLAAQAQVAFSPPVNISNDAGNSAGQQIAVDSSGNINVVWLDNTPGFYAVFFSRSSDGGATFSSPQDLSNGQADAGDPQIAVDSTGNIYVAWASPVRASNADILFTRSSDGGATFSAPTIISNHPSGGARGPSMAVDSAGNINVAWWGAYAPKILFFSRSSDGGGTFSTPINVSNTSGANSGQLAVDLAGNINVVWCAGFAGFQVAFSRSIDGGASFTTPNMITTGTMDTCSPTMALDSPGNIYIAWDFQPYGDIYVSRSSDGGATFSSTDITNKTTNATSSQERITTDSNGNIYVVWAQIPPGDNHTYVFLSHSSDGGATFSTPQNLSSNLGGSEDPQIATGLSGNINIVWQDIAPGNWEVFFAQSSDGGATFSSPQNLSNDPGASHGPVIAMDPTSNVNVLWMDNTPGNNDVFFSRSEPPPTLISLGLSPSTVTGSSSSTGTVTLSNAAPNGDAVVSLSSSNTGAATVPASVTVPAGSTSATFTMTTSPVATSTAVTISGSYIGSTQTATLTVVPPTLTSLTLNPSNVIGGPLGSSTGAVTLSGPAPIGGAVVSLSSSGPPAAIVPNSVTVPAGATSATFAVRTSIVVIFTTVTISGSYNDTTQSANLTILL